MFTPPQIAKRLQVSEDTVRAWIRTGELPAVNFAGPKATRPRYRITEEGLATLMNRKSVENRPQPVRQEARAPLPKVYV